MNEPDYKLIAQKKAYETNKYGFLYDQSHSGWLNLDRSSHNRSLEVYFRFFLTSENQIIDVVAQKIKIVSVGSN